MSGSVLTVDLSQLRTNLRLLQKHTDVPLLVVVKANAYGHGIGEIGRVCEAGEAALLGVVHIEEVRALREARVCSGILLMGAVQISELEEAHHHHAEIALWRLDQIDAAAEIGVRSTRDVQVHIKLDTGMGRFGVLPKDLSSLLDALDARKGIEITGFYSHFAAADEGDKTSVMRQLQTFRECLALLGNRCIKPRYIHMANSPASLAMPEAYFTMARVGIALYGLPPSDELGLLPGMAPIASWTSLITNVKQLPPGHGVGYGAEFITSKTATVGVIAAGYADGFRRYPKSVNTVLFNGQVIPVIGRICMDYCMIDLSDFPDARLGDEVVLMGQSGDCAITADMLANRWGTNNYDVLTNIGSRVVRKYI